MGWGGSFGGIVSSVTNAVTSAAQSTYNAGSKAVVAGEKLASNPTTAKIMPLAALYTGTGRENLMSGPYAQLAGPAASMILGPGAGATVGSMISGGLVPQQGQSQADAGWGIGDLLSMMLGGDGGGGGVVSPGTRPVATGGTVSTAGGTNWLPWIIGGVAAFVGLLVLVLVIRRK